MQSPAAIELPERSKGSCLLGRDGVVSCMHVFVVVSGVSG